MPSSTSRIAIVTDIHHGPAFQTKRSDSALDLLDGFVSRLGEIAPDLVVDLGDRINDVDLETDRILMREVADRFKRIRGKREHLPGNHDVRFLSIAENETLFDAPMTSRSLDINGWHLVFWCPDMRYSTGTGFAEDPGALTWLERDLADNPGPSVIFCHVPQFAGALRGNFWFQNNPWAAALPYAEVALNILTGHPGVTMTVGGHLHWARLQTLGGIHHVTLPSLIEGFFTGGPAAGAWTEIELGESITVTVRGREPWRWELPLRPSGRSWPTPRASARKV